MSETVIYDAAQVHLDDNFPADLPPSQAYVHTGMYLAWLVEHEYLAPAIVEKHEQAIAEVKAKAITGPALFEKIGGVLSSEMLTDEGNAFTSAYFDFDTGDFLGDYEDSFCEALPSIYHVDDSWDNYEYLTASLDVRFEAWKSVQ